MIGKRFGCLVVIDVAEDYIAPTGGVHKKVLCKCDCGNVTVVCKDHLNSGKTKSCGCLRKVSRGCTHQEIKTRLYRIWGNMVNRCTNPNNPAWPRYGGRGIFVCDEWRKYENFRDWARENGYTEDLTIDRINNDKGYYPENCRWADIITQSNNKSTNHYIEYDGEIKTMTEWAKTLNIPYKLLHHRIVGLNWDIHRAFTQKPRKSPTKKKVS